MQCRTYNLISLPRFKYMLDGIVCCSNTILVVAGSNPRGSVGEGVKGLAQAWLLTGQIWYLNFFFPFLSFPLLLKVEKFSRFVLLDFIPETHYQILYHWISLLNFLTGFVCLFLKPNFFRLGEVAIPLFRCSLLYSI